MPEAMRMIDLSSEKAPGVSQSFHTDGLRNSQRRVMTVNATKLAEMMQVTMDQASAHVVTAGKALERVTGEGPWVIGELRRLSTEIKAAANGFNKACGDLPDNLKFCALSFDEAVRTLAGALNMAATALENRDTHGMVLAQVAQQQAVLMAGAAFGALIEPDLPPEILQ
jgi:hypothetical protein